MEILNLNQAHYPEQLSHIHQPPTSLFAKGNIKLLSSKCIGVVGPRKASFYGIKVAEHIVKGLVEAGYCIVSGLAMGIDSAAHTTALEHGGQTIAVVGSGLDIIYPSRNYSLFKKISETGLVVSEHPLGTPALKHHFPLRNRIISGLSQAVVVIEASHKSGSLITAEYAFNQNREVFAIPGNIFRSTSAGAHNLIAYNKAKLVTSAAEIIHHLTATSQLTMPFGLQPRQLADINKKLSQLSSDEQKIIDIIEATPSTAQSLAKSKKLPLNRITTILTSLELKEFIRKLPGGRYQAL